MGSPEVGSDAPHQYCCLKNSMDRRAWQTRVHGAAELDMTEHTHTSPCQRLWGDMTPNLWCLQSILLKEHIQIIEKLLFK